MIAALANTFWTTTAASSVEEHWNTPKHVVALVEGMLESIDLDPCSDKPTDQHPNVPAKDHFTGSPKDGLVEPWCGRVFCNPPYGRMIGQWARKALNEFTTGRATEIILLVPARVDTRWFRSLLMAKPTICFLNGRLRFGNQPAPAPFPSALIYFGPRAMRFGEVFRPLGWLAQLTAAEDHHVSAL